MRGYKAEQFLGISTLGLLILAGGAADAASVTVNFDVLPDGSPYVAQATFAVTPGPLRDEYQAEGVHFLGGGGVLTGIPGVIGTSAPNFMMFNVRQMAAYQDGVTIPAPPETIAFDRPANLVKLNVGSYEGGTASLTAYDAGGNVVGSTKLPLSVGVSPLEVQSNSYNIASVQLALTGSRSMVADDLVFMIEDHTNVPPVTECTLSGPAGANGWYVGDVTAALSATDADDPVAATHYRLDGGDWQPYSASVVVTGDGAHTLEYQSLDSNGLWEDVKSQSIHIDTAGPVVELQPTPSVLYAVQVPRKPAKGKTPVVNDLAPVVVNGSAADACSGVGAVTFEVTDEYGEVQPTVTSFGQTVMLPATVKRHARSGRWYKLTATATDEAGLTSSISKWVRVVRGRGRTVDPSNDSKPHKVVHSMHRPQPEPDADLDSDSHG